MKTLLCSSLLGVGILLSGCGSVYEEVEEAPPRKIVLPQNGTEVGSAGPVDSAEAPPQDDDGPDPAREKAKLERLAERLLSGGIGYSGGRSAFVVVTTYTEEGNGTGILGSIASEKNDYDGESTLCEPTEDCSATSETLLAKTIAWLDKEKLGGTVLLEAAEFKPVGGFPVAELGAIGGKLVFKKDHLDVIRGTKTASLSKIEFGKEHKPTPVQAAASPDGSLVVTLYSMDPGANYGKGFNQFVDVNVQRVP